MSTPAEPFNSRSNGAGHLRMVDRRDAATDGVMPAACPVFAGLPPADCTRICAGARVKEFARGEVLYIEGDPVQQVLLLAEGFAKINKLGMNGAEVILRFSAPGDVLGAAGLLSTGRHATTAQAFRLCRALVWEAPAFKALVERFPALHLNMVRILSADLRDLEERFREVATERVGPRVARQILRLMDKIGRPVRGAIEIGLSREELAQMNGTTLFTVSRLLSAWEASGIVSSRREAVTICDVESLRAIGSGDKSLCPEETITVRKQLVRKASNAAG